MPPQIPPLMQSDFRFKWTTTALNYLGTKIPADLSRTYDLNFPPLLAQTKVLLDKWHTNLHSWFGRCNLLKMCILPKLLYLFQALPIKIPISYFRQVQTLFTRFVWAHKKTRITRSQLTLPKHYGGLALSDIRKYYQAVHLGRVIDWHRHRNGNYGHR